MYPRMCISQRIKLWKEKDGRIFPYILIQEGDLDETEKHFYARTNSDLLPGAVWHPFACLGLLKHIKPWLSTKPDQQRI